ncbi:MAG TPA: PilZ domain-containing protein [Terriglobales bacterium]|nr:PilZ domain-containing protein [Terriglobales bacterium]
MSINRRQYDRLQLSEAAYAVDESGRQLGKVSQASGGGMLIIARDASYLAEAEAPEVGTRFTVTIMEPYTQTSNTVDVIVRYKDGARVGVEFVGAE